MALLDLRRINRAVLSVEESAKAATEAAKAPVEGTTLQLHNLQYEMNHYAKAIAACRDFRTKYPGIHLVPFDHFLREAPAHLLQAAQGQGAPSSSGAGAGGERDGPMIPRLTFELLQRKLLAKQRQELEMRRRTLQESINSRKKFLAGLPAQLKVLKSATQPLQQHLQVSPALARAQANHKSPAAPCAPMREAGAQVARAPARPGADGMGLLMFPMLGPISVV